MGHPSLVLILSLFCFLINFTVSLKQKTSEVCLFVVLLCVYCSYVCCVTVCVDVCCVTVFVDV